MDKNVVSMILALNVIAIAVLYQRFGSTDFGTQMQSKFMSSVQPLLQPYYKLLQGKDKPTERCGVLKWDTYVLTSNRIIFPDGIRPGAVVIKGSKIVKVLDSPEASDYANVLNFKDSVIMAGVIDVHIHLNEPGREEWEGMSTGTAAAVAGGVTTVVDMPLNSDPVTTTVEQLRAKQALVVTKSQSNMGFWAGLVPENAANHTLLEELVAAGALGFKSFMCPSGINDFPHVGREDIVAALPFLKARGVPYFVHAEVVSPVEVAEDADPTVYATYLSSRPPSFETDAIQLLIEVLDADTTPAHPNFSVHIAHLVDADTLDLIQEAQARHPITVETCGHYLTFASEDIPDKRTTLKCAPPIRSKENREKLIAAVADGRINLVSSDHSPAPPALKEVESGDFMKAWGGITGVVQYLLPATWTALSRHGAPLTRLAEVLSANPAKLAGLSQQKGIIAAGYDADLVVWEPEQPANTSLAADHHKHKLSPFQDMPLMGRVQVTVVDGNLVYLFGSLSPRACGLEVKRD